MSVYEWYSCPKCGKGLESMVSKGSKGIGEPFRKCSKCGTYVIIKSLFNEWELMDYDEKQKIKWLVPKTALIIGGTIGYVIGLFGGYYIIGDKGVGTMLMIGLPCFAIGAFIHYFFVRKGLNKSIEESNMRMSNPIYREELRMLGFWVRKT